MYIHAIQIDNRGNIEIRQEISRGNTSSENSRGTHGSLVVRTRANPTRQGY